MAAPPSTCDVCSTDTPATVYCPPCRMRLCDPCDGRHRAHSRFSGHTCRPLASLNFCPAHPRELLDWMCITCDDVICGKCIMGKHVTHEMGVMSDTWAGLRKSLEAYIAKYEDCNFRSVADFRKRLKQSREDWLKYLKDLHKVSHRLTVELDTMTREVSEYISVGLQEISQAESAIIRRKLRGKAARLMLGPSPMSRGDWKIKARKLLSEPDDVVDAIPVSSPHPKRAFPDMLGTLRALCEACFTLAYDAVQVHFRRPHKMSEETGKAEGGGGQAFPVPDADPQAASGEQISAKDLNGCVITGEEPPKFDGGVWSLTQKELTEKLQELMAAVDRYDLSQVAPHRKQLKKLRKQWTTYLKDVRKEANALEEQIDRRKAEIDSLLGLQLLTLSGPSDALNRVHDEIKEAKGALGLLTSGGTDAELVSAARRLLGGGVAGDDPLFQVPALIIIIVPRSLVKFDGILDGFQSFIDDFQVVSVEGKELRFANKAKDSSSSSSSSSSEKDERED